MKPKAIVLGLVTWFTLDMFSLGLSFVLLGHLSYEQGGSFVSPITMRILRFIAGVITGFLAGYVAGRVAKSAEITHAITLGAIIAVLRFALTLWLSRRLPLPVIYIAVVRIVDFAAVLFGGWLANWRNEMTNKTLQPRPLARSGEAFDGGPDQ